MHEINYVHTCKQHLELDYISIISNPLRLASGQTLFSSNRFTRNKLYVYHLYITI